MAAPPRIRATGSGDGRSLCASQFGAAVPTAMLQRTVRTWQSVATGRPVLQRRFVLQRVVLLAARSGARYSTQGLGQSRVIIRFRKRVGRSGLGAEDHDAQFVVPAAAHDARLQGRAHSTHSTHSTHTQAHRHTHARTHTHAHSHTPTHARTHARTQTRGAMLLQFSQAGPSLFEILGKLNIQACLSTRSTRLAA